MKSKTRTLVVWIVLISVLVVLYQWNRGDAPQRVVELETFIEDVEDGNVAAVWVSSNKISVRLSGGVEYTTYGILDDEITERLSQHAVPVHWGEESSLWSRILPVLVPVLLLAAAVVFFLKKAGANTTNVLALRKSTAKQISDSSKVTFADVGGCCEAKEQLADVIHFLRDPKPWAAAGARLPHGVLLEGPPGCGKTLLARAVAGETDARFYLVSASEFVEMFVGVGAARVRDTFETAVKNAPSVIFIDELDAVGRRRGSGLGAAHDEREQTLNQLLVCLDGFLGNGRVVVIGATNRPDILDRALVRSGRFDRTIKIPELRPRERLAVLQIHTRRKNLHENVSLEALAARTEGFNGAELENLANEAALLAVRRCRREGVEACLTMSDFFVALETTQRQSTRFTRLDQVLIESVNQVSEPSGRAVVRITLKDRQTVEGDIVWADAGFLKVRDGCDLETVVPKSQIVKFEALEGTEATGLEETISNLWTRQPEVA